MNKESNSPGCLGLIGVGFAIVAGLCVIAGFVQDSSASAAFLPFIGSTVISVLCFTLVDIRDRLTRIERHFGIKQNEEEEDSNTNLEPISKS
jgi:hypothetical protein